MQVAKRFLSLFRKKKTDRQDENVNQNVENVEKDITWIFKPDSASVLRISFHNGELVFEVSGVKRKDGKFKLTDCSALSDDQYTIIEDECDRIFIQDFSVIDMNLLNLDMEEGEESEDHRSFEILLQRLKNMTLKCGVFKVSVNEKYKEILNDILPLLAFETLHLRNIFSLESLSDLLINPELKETPEKRGRLRVLLIRRIQSDGVRTIPGIQQLYHANYRLDVDGATIFLVCDADLFDVHIIPPNTHPNVTPTTFDGIFN